MHVGSQSKADNRTYDSSLSPVKKSTSRWWIAAPYVIIVHKCDGGFEFRTPEYELQRRSDYREVESLLYAL